MQEFLRESSFLSNSGSNNGAGGDDSPSKKSLALKEQEKWIDAVKKENFSLKLRVHTLEEVLSRTPGNKQDILQENVDLKVSFEKIKAQLSAVQAENHMLKSSRPSSNDNSVTAAVKERLREQADKFELLRSQYQESQRRVSALETQLATFDEHAASGSTVLEDTLIEYRHDIERLEQELSRAKSQLLDQNTALQQRAVEVEQLRGQNDSLRVQLMNKSHENLNLKRSASREMSFAAESSGFANNNSTAFDRSFDSLNEASMRPTANQQLERGIGLLRDQISDLKLQLIDKTSSMDHLLIELEARNQTHNKTLSQLQDGWSREELKLRNTISELKEQLNRARSEAQALTIQLDSVQRQHHTEETQLQMQVQNVERQLQSKNEKLSEALQKIDKLSAQLKTVESTLELKKSHADQLSRQLDSKSTLIQTSEKDHLRMLDQLNTRLATLQDQLTQSSITVQSKDNELGLLREQIERQKAHISTIEERWIKQTKDVANQQRDVRQEMEQQIHQFKVKVSTLSQSEQEKESRIKELTSQLEMHSIGMEESIRGHVQEKERMKVDLQQFYTENEGLKRELARWQHRLGELDLAYKESVNGQDSLTITINSLEDKLKRLSADLSDRDKSLRQAEQELREKNQQLKELNQKLVSTEDAIIEGHHVVSVVEQRFTSQIEERNHLLMKVQALLDEFLSAGHIVNMSFSIENPSNNFFSFADGLVERIQVISQLPTIVDHKIRRIEHKFTDEMRQLSQKLDRKISQLEQFESIVKEAVLVQRRMRENLKSKQAEIQQDKVTISGLEHQVTILKHELTSVKSEASILTTAERSKLQEVTSRLVDMERNLREKDRKSKEDRVRIQELDDVLSRHKQSSAHRISELTDHLRLLRQELELSQKQCVQLDSMLKQRSSMPVAAETSSSMMMQQKSSMQSLLETSEAAYEKLNHQLAGELDSLRRSLENERLRCVSLEHDIMSYKSELQKVKKKLEKRESMIEMALSKLELVNHRKDGLEATILNQFSDDMRRMMMQSTDSVASLRASAAARRSQTVGDFGLVAKEDHHRDNHEDAHEDV